MNPSERITEPSAKRHSCGKRQHIGVNYPLKPSLGNRKITLHNRKRYTYDRLIDKNH
jgi:hypothetical protein